MATQYPGDSKYPKSRFANSIQDPIDDIHPSSERLSRFPKDDLLREHGWKIHSRPSKGEAFWEKDGRVLPLSRVLMELPPIKEMKTGGRY